MKFMTVRVRFTEFVKDSEDLENSNLFVFVHIKFEMFEFVWEGKIWRMTPLLAAGSLGIESGLEGPLNASTISGLR